MTFARLLRSAIVTLVAVIATTAGPIGDAGRLPTACAQDAEPTQEELAAARQLFKEGLALEKEDQWREALDRFERVAKVKLSPQVRFHVALCNEKLGNLVEAINGFELAEQEARAAGPKAKDVAVNAPARAKELRDRVGYVRLTVTGTIRTSIILLDGRPISEALVDTDIPVEPGVHEISVDRDAETVMTKTVTVERQKVAELELEIDDPEPPPEDQATGPTPPDGPSAPLDDGSSRWPAYLVGGIGLAGIVAGGVCWGVSRTLLADVRDTCESDNTGCDPSMKATAINGRTYTTVGNIAVPVGGAALATGVVLWFVLGPSEEGDDDADEDEDDDASVALIPTGTGAILVGTF
ncbi:MAG: hypothetical protein JRI23_08100 [Deltaproteobacteria bacterium]|jgi:hypothetical protein|nr:hypothetical protein [Deltaproteobacteria bacterium]MBW2531574.1 hypothetical protein [Deltaproteobacteria bacterium]